MCVDPALEHPNVPLETEVRVTRLETDASERQVTAVVAERADGSPVRYSGDVVAVSCGALNSAPLFARVFERPPPAWPGQRLGPSRSQLHTPQQHGRHRALPHTQPDPPAEDVGVQRRVLKGEDWDYPWGSIQMLGKSDGEQLQAMAPHVLAWGAKLTPGSLLEDVARHGVDFWMSSEDLPRADSRVTLDKDGGSPCPRTTTPRG